VPRPAPLAAPAAAIGATAGELLCTQWGMNPALVDAMRLMARSPWLARSSRERYLARLAALPLSASPLSEAPPSRTVLLLSLPVPLQRQHGGAGFVAAVCALAGDVHAVEFANVPIDALGSVGARVAPSALVMFACRADAEAALSLDNTPLCGATLTVKRAQRAPDLRHAWQPPTAAGAAAAGAAGSAAPAEPRAHSRHASDDGDEDDERSAGDALQSCAEWGVSPATVAALLSKAAGARARHASSIARLPAGAAPGESAKLRSVRLRPLPAMLVNRPHRIATLLSVAGDVDAIELYSLTDGAAPAAGAVVVFARRADALAALALDGSPLCDGQMLCVMPPKREPDLQLAWQPPHKRRRAGGEE
jgi:hypothetical protein